MRLKGVIFDLDGTLADTMPLCRAAFVDVFGRFADRPWTVAEIEALYGPSEEGIVRHATADRAAECLEAYLAFYEREHDALARPIAEVDTLLGWLAERSVRLAVVTGKGALSAEVTLQRLGLHQYIQEVRCGSPDGSVKPAAIRDILQSWRADPADVAYVGDAPGDMRASAEVSTLPLGAAWADGADADALRAAGAVAVFSSPRALQHWLAEIA
jgi:pyrophosphatase PpaX